MVSAFSIGTFRKHLGFGDFFYGAFLVWSGCGVLGSFLASNELDRGGHWPRGHSRCYFKCFFDLVHVLFFRLYRKTALVLALSGFCHDWRRIFDQRTDCCINPVDCEFSVPCGYPKRMAFLVKKYLQSMGYSHFRGHWLALVYLYDPYRWYGFCSRIFSPP
jgi:hypothetical protein